MKNKWIDVKDRLPNKSGNYLVALKDRFGEYSIMTLSYEAGVYGWESYASSFCTLTHWMPLPEPPQED